MPYIIRMATESSTHSEAQQTSREGAHRRLELVLMQLQDAESILVGTGKLDTIEWLAGLYSRVSRASQVIREVQANLA